MPKRQVIKEGDFVKVFRKGTNADFKLSGHEHNTWEPEMDSSVGRLGRVIEVSNHGVALEIDDHDFDYPENCLKLVKTNWKNWLHSLPAKKKEKVMIEMANRLIEMEEIRFRLQDDEGGIPESCLHWTSCGEDISK